jgi:hypothetical protein
MGSPKGMEQVDKRNAALQRMKERKEGLKHVIDLYMALKPERNIQKHALTEQKEDNAFSIIQLNETHGPRVFFNKTLFETRMAKEIKTFAFLDRGRPFGLIHLQKGLHIDERVLDPPASDLLPNAATRLGRCLIWV